ncbi:MAG: thioredoxin family protein [Candidatus Doudnabacteria bacterium]|nr:thioredoxin family protein [Candidatus Doudnabacteria bacterium]
MKPKILLPILLGIALLAVSCKQQPSVNTSIPAENQTKQMDTMDKEGQKGMEKSDAEMMDDEAMMEKKKMEEKSQSSSPTSSPQPATQPQAGVYIDYSAQALAQAQVEGKRIVLNFYAPWCPFCRAADADFQANLGRLPENLVLLRVQYDSEKELKSKYGVTYQHTFVQVDEQSKQVTKWSGGGIDELIARVK